MLNTRRFVVILMVIGLIGLLFPVSALPKELIPVSYIVDGAFFLKGPADDAIADREKVVAQLKRVTVEDTIALDNMKIFNRKMKEAGYYIIGEDWGWAEQLTQKEVTAFMAGRGPDVIIGEVQMPGFAVQGYLTPFPEWLVQKIKEEVVPGAYLPMMYKGKMYGIAPYPGVSALFWNKKLLREAGLDPNKAPTTWEEWLKMANAVTKAGKGKFWGGGVYAGPNHGGGLRVGPFMLMAGGGFVDSENNIIFDSPGNVRALSFIRELNKNLPPGVGIAPGEGSYWDAFQKGIIAYVVDGPWRYAISRDLGIDIGMAPLPVPAGGKAANITIGACFYAVPKYSKNDGAWKFIETLIDPEVQENLARSMLRPPVLKKVAEQEWFKKTYMYTFYQALSGDVKGLPTYAKNSNKIWDVFYQNMTKAMATNIPVERILKDAQKQAEELLR